MEADLNDLATKRLTDILRASAIPLSLRDLGVRLRLRHHGLADHEISALLRSMLHDGQVEFQKGRWAVPSYCFQADHAWLALPMKRAMLTLHDAESAAVSFVLPREKVDLLNRVVGEAGRASAWGAMLLSKFR